MKSETCAMKGSRRKLRPTGASLPADFGRLLPTAHVFESPGTTSEFSGLRTPDQPNRRWSAGVAARLSGVLGISEVLGTWTFPDPGPAHKRAEYLVLRSYVSWFSPGTGVLISQTELAMPRARAIDM